MLISIPSQLASNYISTLHKYSQYTNEFNNYHLPKTIHTKLPKPKNTNKHKFPKLFMQY